MLRAEFVGGPLDGQETVVRDYDYLLKEVIIDGDVYGFIDCADLGEDLYVLYGHIERLERPRAADD